MVAHMHGAATVGEQVGYSAPPISGISSSPLRGLRVQPVADEDVVQRLRIPHVGVRVPLRLRQRVRGRYQLRPLTSETVSENGKSFRSPNTITSAFASRFVICWTKLWTIVAWLCRCVSELRAGGWVTPKSG